MITEQESDRRCEIVRRLVADQITAELSHDLRELAGQFAAELHALRAELRQALGLPPLICECDREDDDRLQ